MGRRRFKRAHRQCPEGQSINAKDRTAFHRWDSVETGTRDVILGPEKAAEFRLSGAE